MTRRRSTSFRWSERLHAFEERDPRLGETPPLGPAEESAVLDPTEESELEAECRDAARALAAARSAAARAWAARADTAGSGRPASKAACRVSAGRALRARSLALGRFRPEPEVPASDGAAEPGMALYCNTGPVLNGCGWTAVWE